MGIESMRVGGGRCPSLLVGVLIIICLMMVCNWWTLSSTNLELLRQIDELNEQIKISVEERDQCVTQRALFEKQLKSYIDDARTMHVRLSQIEDNMSTCKEELESHKRVDITRTATLEALRVDKEAITAQLDAKKKENRKLEEELKKVQDDFDKLKLSIKTPLQKSIPVLPIVMTGAKPPDNKTVNVLPQSQVINPPVNAERQETDIHEKDNSNMKDDTAAEVHDAANVIDSELNLNLDAKMNENRN